MASKSFMCPLTAGAGGTWPSWGPLGARPRRPPGPAALNRCQPPCRPGHIWLRFAVILASPHHLTTDKKKQPPTTTHPIGPSPPAHLPRTRSQRSASRLHSQPRTDLQVGGAQYYQNKFPLLHCGRPVGEMTEILELLSDKYFKAVIINMPQLPTTSTLEINEKNIKSIQKQKQMENK